MLEEPLGRSPSFFAPRTLGGDPFFDSQFRSRPAFDVTEQGNSFIVEADLPGVKKENIDIRVGEGGRSITISGRTFAKRNAAPTEAKQGEEIVQSSDNTTSGEDISPDSSAIAQHEPNQLTVERAFTGGSSFTRSVYLPYPIDASAVRAKLVDGVLTLEAPKAEDKASVQIAIE